MGSWQLINFLRLGPPLLTPPDHLFALLPFNPPDLPDPFRPTLPHLCLTLPLQSFNPQKRMEHHFKAMVHDSKSISVTNPSAYAQRFQNFMKRVFK